jgi:predicted enzyme related to lactoylglutathione lyase
VHFEVFADDPDRAMSFYRSVLGWSFKRWGEFDYWLAATGPQDAAGINGALMKRDRAIDGDSVIAFVCTANVDDIDATVAAAVSGGAELTRPKRAVPGIGWHAYIKDTEGNVLGLMQDDSEAA